MLIINKDDNINVENNLCKLFSVKQCFPFGKLTLNVGYFFHL